MDKTETRGCTKEYWFGDRASQPGVSWRNPGLLPLLFQNAFISVLSVFSVVPDRIKV
jgi:hypothetical protein